MNKKEKIMIRALYIKVGDKCTKSKPGKYDGIACCCMPKKEWPLEEWCAGCLMWEIYDLTKK